MIWRLWPISLDSEPPSAICRVWLLMNAILAETGRDQEEQYIPQIRYYFNGNITFAII
jgi:hypothetical protein